MKVLNCSWDTKKLRSPSFKACDRFVFHGFCGLRRQSLSWKRGLTTKLQGKPCGIMRCNEILKSLTLAKIEKVHRPRHGREVLFQNLGWRRHHLLPGQVTHRPSFGCPMLGLRSPAWDAPPLPHLHLRPEKCVRI